MGLKSSLMDEDDRQRQERKRRRAEDNVLAETNSRRIPASGALPGLKGDGLTRDRKYRIEHKWTGRKSYPLRLDLLSKIMADSRLYDETPVIVVSFEEAQCGTPKDWVVLPLSEFERLREIERTEDAG